MVGRRLDGRHREMCLMVQGLPSCTLQPLKSTKSYDQAFEDDCGVLFAFARRREIG